MAKTNSPLYPALVLQMEALGLRLKRARLRRDLTTVDYAEQVGVSRDTLNRLEKGDPSIAVGTYLRALAALGLELDLDAIAREDAPGRELQDLKLERPRGRHR